MEETETLPVEDETQGETDEKPAESVAAEPEVEPGTEPTKAPDGEPDEKPAWFRKRFDEITAKRIEAERRAAYWEGKATAGEQGKPETPAAEAKPKQEAFGSYEEYIEAITDWKLTARLTAERTRIQQEAQQQTVAQGFEAQVKSAREKHADFDAVVYSPDLKITETMREVVLQSEDGAKLAYHLGQHPEEAARIAGLLPTAQILAIGRLQAKLDSPAPAAPIPPYTSTTGQASNAPAPITPVKANAPATTGIRDELGTEDWMRKRNAQLRAR